MANVVGFLWWHRITRPVERNAEIDHRKRRIFENTKNLA
jgi:hypothetical protein